MGAVYAGSSGEMCQRRAPSHPGGPAGRPAASQPATSIPPSPWSGLDLGEEALTVRPVSAGRTRGPKKVVGRRHHQRGVAIGVSSISPGVMTSEDMYMAPLMNGWRFLLSRLREWYKEI